MRTLNVKLYSGLSLLGVGGLLSSLNSPAAPAANVFTSDWQKPAWLTDLSFTAKESYDDNILLVADQTPGMSAQGSWITTISPKVGFNFAPVLGSQKALQTLSLVYSPDFNFFHNAPSESFNAHKLGDSIKGQAGDFSFAVDNSFLFDDGSSTAPTYAGDDKNRSNYATTAARERRKQIQDRANVNLQYDVGKFFVRPTAALTFYDLMTDWKNTAGYQNYADRADVNGGADVGYRLTSDLALTVGYRYGHQYQQALTPGIGATYQSSSDYQRVLLGLEGKPWNWLTVKLLGGPDFRDYNATAPVNDYHPTTYYGEASLTAALTSRQSLTFNYKQWRWVSSTGKVPFMDSTFALNYHWNVTSQLGLDAGGKFLDSNYTCGSAVKSGNSSLRNDAQYTASAGVSYAFTKNLSASLAYAYDFGRNLQDDASFAAYRQFDHQTVSLGATWKF